MPFAFPYNSPEEAPFVVCITHENQARNGSSWTPSAHVCVMPALHASGFWSEIGDEEFKSLLLLLSFLAPDGRCAASVPQLARALRTSHRQARSRFQRLAAARWHGAAIVFHSEWGGDLDGFAPAPGFLPVIEAPEELPQASGVTVVPRDVLITHSRSAYARPREEVEREIARMMDWKSLEPAEVDVLTPQERQLKDDLLAVGLLEEQALELMTRFDALRIRRQLAWLPYRQAKNRAGYLIAAIKDNYAAPRAMNIPLDRSADIPTSEKEHDAKG